MNILLIILIIIAIPFIRALLLKKEYIIEREIIIDKPRQEVFDYIKFQKNGENYNKWIMTDPNMKKEFTGVDGTVGFIYAWDSENKQVGKGEQETKQITDGKRIDFEIRFIKPFEGKAGISMATDSVSENQTKVKWAFDGIRNYPMRIMHLLLNLKKMLGKDLQTSLANLKTVLEKK